MSGKWDHKYCLFLNVIYFLHLNSLLYVKQSEFFSAEDEIVFGRLSPFNKTMILHFISLRYFLSMPYRTVSLGAKTL